MIKNKIHELYENGSLLGFSTYLDWYEEYHYNYYLHFNDADPFTRAGSIYAFLGMLLNWEIRVAKPFTSNPKNMPINRPHQLDNYVYAFLLNAQQIKQDFPKMDSAIIFMLNKLDSQEKFEKRLPGIALQLFEDLRRVILIEIIVNPIKNFDLREVIKEAQSSLK